MKYIRTKHHGFVIFTDAYTHREVANKMCEEENEVVSAGFVNFGLDDKNCFSVDCYGASVSLGTQSNMADSGSLMRYIRGY